GRGRARLPAAVLEERDGVPSDPVREPPGHLLALLRVEPLQPGRPGTVAGLERVPCRGWLLPPPVRPTHGTSSVEPARPNTGPRVAAADRPPTDRGTHRPQFTPRRADHTVDRKGAITASANSWKLNSRPVMARPSVTHWDRRASAPFSSSPARTRPRPRIHP